MNAPVDPDSITYFSDAGSLERVVTIHNYGRSGSALLASLLDSQNYVTSFIHSVFLTRAVLPALMILPFRIERLVWKWGLKSFSFGKAGQLIDLYIRLRRKIMDLWRKDRDSDSGFLKVIGPKTPGLQ